MASIRMCLQYPLIICALGSRASTQQSKVPRAHAVPSTYCADAQILLREGGETKHTEAHFLPWVTLCLQHFNLQLPKHLSPSGATLTLRQFNDYFEIHLRRVSEQFPGAQQPTEGFCFDLRTGIRSSTNGPFLDTFILWISLSTLANSP